MDATTGDVADEIALEVRSADDRAQGGQRLQHDLGGVPEAVSLTDTDQRDSRTPLRKGIGNVAVRASVVSDLDRVHGTRPRLKGPDLRAVLSVAEQERVAPVTFQKQDDARIVRVEQPLSALRPEHPRRDPTDPERHVAAKADDRIRSLRTVSGEPLHGIVLDVRDRDPIRASDACEPFDPPGVVVVRMREHEPVQSAHARAGKRTAQRDRLGTRVHEHRVAAVSDQDRVALPHVEHDKTRHGRAADAGEHKRQGEKPDRDGSRARRPPRLRPAHPDGEGGQRPCPADPAWYLWRRKEGARHPRSEAPQARGEPGDDRCEPEEHAARDRRGPSRKRARESDHDRRLHDRRGEDEHERTEKCDSTEERGAQGCDGDLGRKRRAHVPAECPTQERARPCARKPPEDPDARHRDRPEREADVVGGARIGEQCDAHDRSERGRPVPPPPDGSGDHRCGRGERRAHERELEPAGKRDHARDHHRAERPPPTAEAEECSQAIGQEKQRGKVQAGRRDCPGDTCRARVFQRPRALSDRLGGEQHRNE